MPIPAPKTEWPPKNYIPALEAIRRDDAILSGEIDVINERRKRQTGGTPYRHRSQYNGGIVGGVSRAFLGNPPAPRESHLITHHLPIAEELTTALTDYLAGKPPQAKLSPQDERNTQAYEALQRLVTSDQFASDWWGAVYRAGALGWVYGRVVWNTSVDEHPWIEWLDADQGIAEFENGRQTGILFWDAWQDDNKNDKIYRLFQHHTAGEIECQLFLGERNNVGYPVPFTAHPRAAYLAELPGLHDGTRIATGATRITAHMLSNYRTRHEWRQHELLRYYSTSDVARGNQIFEDIDHNWSQLQHEVEAARGRILVSEELLDDHGPGKGQSLNWLRDVYSVGMQPNPDQQPTLEQVQFDMRVEQYLTLIDSGVRKAVSALGLSPFTVDMDPQASGDMTATETKARTKRTQYTADTKGRMQRAHLSAMLTAYLELDAGINGYAAPTAPVLVSLPDQVEVTEQELENSIANMFTAGVMSLHTAVKKQHPEWTPEEMAEEVRRIQAERRLNDYDPLAGLSLDEVPGVEDDEG